MYYDFKHGSFKFQYGDWGSWVDGWGTEKIQDLSKSRFLQPIDLLVDYIYIGNSSGYIYIGNSEGIT